MDKNRMLFAYFPRRLYLYDMRNALYIVILFFPLLTFAQPMEWQPQGIPVHYEDRELPIPWIGGITDSKPEFVDIDGDGDFDCFIGDNTGKLWYLKNCGSSTEPQWEFISDFFDSIYVETYCSPAFCDIDADYDYDLFTIGHGLVGSYTLTIWYYTNLGTSTFPYYLFITDTLLSAYGCQGIDFGDVDNDNDYDLIRGYSGGGLRLYSNEGDSSSFLYLTDTLIINTSYYPDPEFVDLDNDNDFDIVYGLENGSVNHLRNDGTPYQYDFTVVTQNLVPATGPDAAPTLVDIDGDGDLDLFVGIGTAGMYTPFGGIRYYENIGSPEVYDFQLITDSYFCIDAGLFSIPRLVDIDADNDLDLFVSSMSGDFAYYENIGTSEEPEFIFIDDNYQGIYTGSYGSIAFADLDADGDYDLLSGRYTGDVGLISLYENIGTASNPQFTLVTNDLLGPITDNDIKPSLCDIDNDNDYDLFIGDGWGQIHFFRNIGNASQSHFDLVTSSYCNIDVGYMATPFFYDIDEDDDYDMFIGYNLGLDPSPVGICFFENIGSSQTAIFDSVTAYWGDITIHSTSSAPCFADIDDDGDADLFIGSTDGGVAFYRNLYYNNSVSNPSNDTPAEFSLWEAYPNPFNSMTTISFNLDKAMPVKLVVYDVLGREVAVLLNQQLSFGSYQLNWNAEGYSSGCYFLRLQAEGAFQTKKIILIE